MVLNYLSACKSVPIRLVFVILLCLNITKQANCQFFLANKKNLNYAEIGIYTLQSENLGQLISKIGKEDLNDRIIAVNEDRSLLLVKLSPQEFDRIHQNEELYDFRHIHPKEESFLSDFFPEVNSISAARNRFPEYFDFNGVISVKENDINPEDIDLLNRVFSSSLGSGLETNHAADMGTIIGGKGNTSSTSLGIVQDALISTTSFLNLGPDADSYFEDNRIHLQNHSYGVEIEDYYGLEALAYDEQVYMNPKLIHVFSAGNRGGESAIFSDYNTVEGFANITGTFKHAKNVLTIGGIDSFSVISAGSSIGPAHDGRIKPDFVAYGYNGTSDAAAITTGCAAVIDRALEVNEYSNDLATTKSILIAGADDLGTKGPDFIYGFGKINLLNSLSIIRKKQIIKANILSNEVLEFEVEIKELSKVKVALSWIDPPAAIDNSKALVNDLDLQIVNSKGNLVLPFQVNYLPEELGEQTNDIGRDSINNSELITFEESGTFIIRVLSSDLLDGEQDFTLAYFDEKQEDLSFTYPFQGGHVSAGSAFRTLWSGGASDSIEFLEYEGFNIFNPYNETSTMSFPDTSGVVNAFAMGANGSVADVSFYVGSIPRLNVSWVCGDSILINWNRIETQDSFEILALQGDEMEVVGTTGNDYFLINRQETSHIAVREKTPDGFDSAQSIAIKLEDAVGNCLYKRFVAEPLDRGARLIFELSSSEFISGLKLQKKQGREWFDLLDFSADQISQSFDDFDLERGENTYRVQIILDDNSSRFSESVSYFYIPAGEVLVFPTYLEADYGLDVWMGVYQELEFNLVNAQGQVVIEGKLLSEFEYFDTNHLASGIYFYTVFNDKEITQQGKVIIHQ
jgi:hypothetical protein